MSKGCCGIFSSHHIQLGFFPFLSLREKYFKILLCLSLIPSLKRSRANTAKSRQPQVSWGHAMSYLMRGNPKNKSYLHNYALIVSGDFYQISVFSLSTKTYNLKVVFCLFGGRSKKKSYLSRVFEAKRKHRSFPGKTAVSISMANNILKIHAKDQGIKVKVCYERATAEL